MDKILQITLLADFYGELLTARQREVFEAYYFDNLSLAEIAENCGVSSQSVNDLLKRTEKLLTDYERKLKLVERHISQTNKINEMLALVDGLDANGGSGPERLKEMLLEFL